MQHASKLAAWKVKQNTLACIKEDMASLYLHSSLDNVETQDLGQALAYVPIFFLEASLWSLLRVFLC
jgi:hypothetical protein